jgi:Txe/YoeB family toxin of Txe-Axe toxin-antitoxin module
LEDKFLDLDMTDGQVLKSILEIVRELKNENLELKQDNESLKKDNKIFKEAIKELMEEGMDMKS